ncbi:MAG: ANTAR domain-containing protein [Ruminococcaceae bacterium]|nr:ANTAR domain-containing protein [Oscillospiraceae bacterium]
MKNIIIAYPVKKTALQIKSVLEENGFYVCCVCATAASVLSMADSMHEGVVIAASILRDMSAASLYEELPQGFDVIALSVGEAEYYSDGIISLSLPLDRADFLNTVAILMSSKSSFTQYGKSDEEIISKAKTIVMNLQGLTEMQAHRYLQNQSMKSGKKLTQVAQDVIIEFKQFGD